jgi:hypothetical protein
LWSDFERALHRHGAVGATVDEKIESLRGRIADADIDRMHYVRRQRNALQHMQAQPLDDPAHWESECRRCIGVLGGETAGWGGTFGKVLLWGVGGWLVLQNEGATQMAGLAFLIWIFFRMISPRPPRK